MHPLLFDLGPFPVYTYGVLLAAAYLSGLWFAVRRARARGLDPDRVMDLGIWIIASALVGAKLLLLVVDFGYYREHPGDLLNVVRSAGVFYGGLIAAVLTAFWYMRRVKLPLWPTTDAFAPGIALGHVVGRLGCFMAGCCWGKPTDLPWAITFTDRLAMANVGTPLGVALHPTQLYEAGAELLILVALLATERRGRSFAGRTFWIYMLAYAVSRFIIEIFRGDPRGSIGVLSTSQLISVILVPVSIFMLVRLGRSNASPRADRAVRRARAARTA
ncbi:MAG TPA: prolipoprotein diacylglyceryl transferase [Gemmatimonadaceae bacterium]|nr:prolipoprotein diacylglyceryl transferase [Gemmatimonadaceae bacterium]